MAARRSFRALTSSQRICARCAYRGWNLIFRDRCLLTAEPNSHGVVIMVVPEDAEPSALGYLTGRLQEAKRCSSREEVFDCALQHVISSGLVCEFGVFEAASINFIARRLPERAVFGFDSFEGLPEFWRPSFDAGAFNVQGRLPQVQPNVTLIKGWFESVLPVFVSEHDGPVALVHVDCDLYSSTKCVLDHLGARLVPGSILIFDEFFNYPGWEQHEFRAFSEFSGASGLGHEYLAYNSQHEQVAVRIVG